MGLNSFNLYFGAHSHCAGGEPHAQARAIVATRSILREWVESTEDEDEALREEALEFKTTAWVMAHGLQMVKDSMGDYESGDETYKRIDSVSQSMAIHYGIFPRLLFNTSFILFALTPNKSLDPAKTSLYTKKSVFK